MKWISVKDIPSREDGYLLYGHEGITVGAYNHKNKCFYSYDDRYDSEITHWMPLPKPPEES